MIKFTVICKSKHWPARVKKISSIIKKILKFKKDLKFRQAITYNCNIILADNNLVKKINYKFRKKKYSDYPSTWRCWTYDNFNAR